MISSDSLIEVLESNSLACKSLIRKSSFDLTINGQVYLDTCSLLSESAVMLRLKISEEYIMIRIPFCFSLYFQVLEGKDEQNLPEIHSIILQRDQKQITISSTLKSKELKVWAQFFTKTLIQRGFHNRYSSIKKIGKGNFATVYLVNRIQDKQRYAVKAFTKQLIYGEEKGKQSLMRQISTMRKSNHKNIIKLEGVYETEHSIYLVLELLEGGLLSDKIANSKKINTLEVKLIMKSLLQGLEAMHKKNIMHRDIKPENILLRKDKAFDCVIADFGLAEQASAEQYLFVRCGTPGYVAPEIVNIRDQKTKYTCACDLFSLGIIFHMLLLRKSPFPGKEYSQILIQNRACSFNFDSYQYRQLPEASLNLLQRLLEKDPQRRITASEALKHSFFYSQFTIWESKKQGKLDSKGTIEEEPADQEQPPVKRSAQRKKMTHIRGDSCLQFKTKVNVQNNTHQDSLTCIKSPETLKLGGGSRFKKMAKRKP